MIRPKLSIIFFTLCILVVGTSLATALIPSQHSDAEILGVSWVMEQIEVQEAYIATQKKVDKEVLDYAKTLNNEIGQHLSVIRKLSQELDIGIVNNTASINHVRDENEADLTALTRLDGVAFAQLYIADTIKGHTEVLNWIDNQATHNEQVKNFLKDTRKNVAKNLDKALEIQKHQAIGQG